MEEKFNRLKELSDKLNKLSVLTDSSMTKLSGQQQVGYELQYDLFMEFLGLYEDTKKEVSSIPNELEKKRFENKLNLLWSENGS